MNNFLIFTFSVFVIALGITTIHYERNQTENILETIKNNFETYKLWIENSEYKEYENYLPIENSFGGLIGSDTDISEVIESSVGSFSTVDFKYSQVESEIFIETNNIRRTVGRKSLRRSTDLDRVARNYAKYQADKDIYMAHDDDRGFGPLDRVRMEGVDNGGAVGENAAWFHQDFQKIATSNADLGERVTEGWENSYGHYKNMIDREWNEIGIGVAFSPDSGYYFIQVFR